MVCCLPHSASSDAVLPSDFFFFFFNVLSKCEQLRLLAQDVSPSGVKFMSYLSKSFVSCFS